MIDRPDARADVHESLQDVYEALTVTRNPIPIKAALDLAGHSVGGLRLPLVEADERGASADPGGARTPQPAGGSLSAASAPCPAAGRAR